MRVFRRSILFFTVIISLYMSALLDARVVYAESKMLTEPSIAVRSGRYIYYAKELHGIRTDLMRYDLKTGSDKSISSYKMANGNETNGFWNLNLQGNYIYCTWDQFIGTGRKINYIYRIHKKTGKKQKLAMGSHCVVAKEKIYYIEEDFDELVDREGTAPTGNICRMDLDGDNQEVITEGVKSIDGLALYGDKVVYYDTDYYYKQSFVYSLDGKRLSLKKVKNQMSNLVFEQEGIYPSMLEKKNGLYYFENGTSSLYEGITYPYSINIGTTLFYKDYISGKRSEIITLLSIGRVIFLDEYIILEGGVYSDSPLSIEGESVLYVMKDDGSAKHELLRWFPAE